MYPVHISVVCSVVHCSAHVVPLEKHRFGAVDSSVQSKPHICAAGAFAPSGATQDHGDVGWPRHARILRGVEDMDQAKNQAAKERCQKGGVACVK